jgi:hypothetical protein
VPHRKTNKEVSDLASTKPKEVMYEVNQLYQARGCLLQPVQRYVEEADTIGLHMINKSSRLAAVDGLREVTTQERILHIKLMNRPGAGDDQGEHGVDCGRLDHWVEGLIVVDTGSLGEAAKDPVSLVPLQ